MQPLHEELRCGPRAAEAAEVEATAEYHQQAFRYARILQKVAGQTGRDEVSGHTITFSENLNVSHG